MAESSVIFKFQIGLIIRNEEFHRSSQEMLFFEKVPQPNCNRRLMEQLTPMSYYYLIKSLLDRCDCVEEATQFLLEPPMPEPFKLAWQTKKE